MTLLATVAIVPSIGSAAARAPRTPVVLFPGYGVTRLNVTVHDQRVAPACPRSGRFSDSFGNAHPSTRFSQVCRDKLLTLRYDGDQGRPMRRRFSTQRGVTIRLADYGKTKSSPFYEPLYKGLEAGGYVRDKNIRVAGYNARLTPDMGGFLERTKRLIEETARANGNRPVHLVGHSNGPIYAQYLLTHISRAWKHQYIHGFTALAGNFPGQGLLYTLLFTGVNLQDFSFPKTAENAVSSARLWGSSPATYMSAADPRIFGDKEVVIENTSTGRKYAPRDYRQLLSDAGLRRARRIADYYLGFVRFADGAHFPNVDVYAEKGSGIQTAVGAPLPNLTVGQIMDPMSAQLFTRDGDINQEGLTNDAVLAWKRMRCYRFSLTDNPGVDHFSLPGNDAVVARLLEHLARPRSSC